MSNRLGPTPIASVTLKFLAKVTLLRTVARVASTLGRLSGVVELMVQHVGIICVQSSTGTREIPLNVHGHDTAKESFKEESK